MTLRTLYKEATLIDDESMAADISPNHVIDLGYDGQKSIAIHIQTSGVYDHIGDIEWEVSNMADSTDSFTPVGDYSITNGSAINHLEDNIKTSARFLRVWYDRTSGGAADTLKVVVHTTEG